MAKNQVLRVLIGCNRQLLLIKIYAGISNIFKTVHHLLKLRASDKGIKQMLFLLFSNFLSSTLSNAFYIEWQAPPTTKDGFALKVMKISCVMVIRWCALESLGRNPEWLLFNE